eukprot:851005-Rhodomonas_salina.1
MCIRDSSPPPLSPAPGNRSSPAQPDSAGSELSLLVDDPTTRGHCPEGCSKRGSPFLVPATVLWSDAMRQK